MEQAARWLFIRPRPGQPPFERPVEVGVAVFIAGGLLRFHSELSSSGLPLSMRVGLGMILAAQFLLIAECLRPSRLLRPALGLATAGLVLNLVGQLGSDGEIVWRVDAWLLSLLVYLVLFRPRSIELAILVSVAIGTTAIAAAESDLDWRNQLLMWLYTLATPLILTLGTRVVAAMVDDHLSYQGSLVHSTESDHALQARTEALSRLRREMHDSLLHCLQLVASPWANMTPDEARSLCASTIEQLPQVPHEEKWAHSEPVGAYLRQALAEEPCRITWNGTGERIPALPATAIGKAARECVRNVIKHCTRAEATVSIRSENGTVRVEIADSGPGFSPDDSMTRGGGWRDSVVERMNSVGGLAQLHPNQQGGTTVALIWPTPVPPPPESLSLRARRRLAVTPIPLVVTSLINMLMSHQGVGIGVATGIWLALVAVIVVTTSMMLRARIDIRSGSALTALAVAAALANYAWIDPSLTNGWDLWVVSLSCAIVLLVLPAQAIRWHIVALAALFCGGTILGAMLLIGARPALTTHYGAALAVLSYTLITLILSIGATKVSHYAYWSRQLEEVAQLRIQAAAQRETVWQEWLDHARALTLPFLTDIADGRRAPDSPATRSEAALLEARIRDDLRLWPGATDLSSRFDGLRRRGWTCRLATDQVPASAHDELGLLLDALPDAAPGQRLTVTSDQGTVTLTIAGPALMPDQQGGIARWLATVDKDFTQATVPAPGDRETAASLR